MMLDNLAKCGYNINVENLTPDDVLLCEYFGMMRYNKELEEKFEVLAKMLNKCFGGK